MGEGKWRNDISTLKKFWMVADLEKCKFMCTKKSSLPTFRNCITKFMSDLAESASPMLAAFSNRSATETLDRRAR
jgi:hypothetical protein